MPHPPLLIKEEGPNKEDDLSDNPIHTPPQIKSLSPFSCHGSWSMGRGRGMRGEGVKKSIIRLQSTEHDHEICKLVYKQSSSYCKKSSLRSHIYQWSMGSKIKVIKKLIKKTFSGWVVYAVIVKLLGSLVILIVVIVYVTNSDNRESNICIRTFRHISGSYAVD